MSTLAVVSIISLLGWMVLALGAYRAHRVGLRQTIVMALIWGAIFLLGVAIFSVIEIDSNEIGQEVPTGPSRIT